MTAAPRSDGPSMLPHHGNARFVTEVLASGDEALICVGRIPLGNPFVTDGIVPGFVLMELAAQAAAIKILTAVESRGSSSSIGFLVRAHGLRWTAEGVPAGVPLTATVRGEGALPPLHLFRATVTREEDTVFAGEFSIYIDKESGQPP